MADKHTVGSESEKPIWKGGTLKKICYTRDGIVAGEADIVAQLVELESTRT